MRETQRVAVRTVNRHRACARPGRGTNAVTFVTSRTGGARRKAAIGGRHDYAGIDSSARTHGPSCIERPLPPPRALARVTRARLAALACVLAALLAPVVAPAKPPRAGGPPSASAPAPASAARAAPAAPHLVEDGHYRNVDGDVVHSPAHTDTGVAPAGASAQCRDGSFSFSAHRRGTCSHHGGVARWL